MVSNHLTGTLAVLPVDGDGALAPVAQTVPMSGEPGPHRKEQPFAKPHYNLVDPSGRYVVVPDKGLDRVFLYALEDGGISAEPASVADTREGAGPRHAAFHPAGRWLYVVNELDNTVAAYTLAAGALQPFQVLPTLPDTYTGNSRAAGISLDAHGCHLYVSNRGDDSIAVFRIDPVNGRLTPVQHALGRQDATFLHAVSRRPLPVRAERRQRHAGAFSPPCAWCSPAAAPDGRAAGSRRSEVHRRRQHQRARHALRHRAVRRHPRPVRAIGHVDDIGAERDVLALELRGIARAQVERRPRRHRLRIGLVHVFTARVHHAAGQRQARHPRRIPFRTEVGRELRHAHRLVADGRRIVGAGQLGVQVSSVPGRGCAVRCRRRTRRWSVGRWVS
ncbi:hypothetical protein G6F35_011362 [Rhizopus arrhizus]|nr:hypothetical protein G6F35_011362 [Rhizopus arrhizus]